MQRGEAAVVGLVHVSTVVRQLIHDRVLPVIAGQVEGRVSVDVDFIDLQVSPKQGGYTPWSSFTPFPTKNLIAVPEKGNICPRNPSVHIIIQNLLLPYHGSLGNACHWR